MSPAGLLARSCFARRPFLVFFSGIAHPPVGRHVLFQSSSLHVMPRRKNRMPRRSTPSGNGRSFRLGELRIEPHGRLNRDRSGMSKPPQAISADFAASACSATGRGDARTPARDRSAAIKFHFISGIFSKTSAAISDRERCLRR
jgi:hypothetical protein